MGQKRCQKTIDAAIFVRLAIVEHIAIVSRTELENVLTIPKFPEYLTAVVLYNPPC
ncbi:unnamed protein product [Brassica oleracea]